MIQVTGINELNERLRAYQKQVSDPKVKTRIMAAGGQVIKRATATSPTPKSKKDHWYYPTKGGTRVKVFSGNLRKSMKVFRGKDGDIYIGPQVLKRVTGDIGKTAKTASGYYAATIFKSAANFRREVTERAASLTMTKVLSAVQKAYARFHDQNAPK